MRVEGTSSRPLSQDFGRTRGGHAPIVLGGGLAGLSAGYALARASIPARVIEADSQVGGLSRTITSECGAFRYDIGGHRFFTRDKHIESFVRGLMGEELLEVGRTSKIFMRGRFFDYPLKPANAVFGLGLGTVAAVVADYTKHAILGSLRRKECVSLEDWVVGKFGRRMFDLYFKEYSEKVWGLDCSRICQSWVSKRIQGLSLGSAIKNAFFKFSGRDIPTLADWFLYPSQGIGRIADRLQEEVEGVGSVELNTSVVRIRHNGARVSSVELSIAGRTFDAAGPHYISTIPMDVLVKCMEPEPPAHVMEAARSLSFRDLMIVALMVDRPSVTDQSWIYIPEKKYPFGRLHEPKIWSSQMAPAEKTLVVVEYFCFRGDGIWNTSDEELERITADGLHELGFIDSSEVMGAEVLRVSRAYPLFNVGFMDRCNTIYGYLAGFENLSIAGRGGTFTYQNMDHAISSGMDAAAVALERMLSGARA